MSSNPAEPGFLPPHGNYQALLSYQKAEVVYDVTYRFCHAPEINDARGHRGGSVD